MIISNIPSFLSKLAAFANGDKPEPANPFPLPPEQTHVKVEELCRILNISNVTAWRRCNAKHPSYDAAFPKPRKFGGNVRRWNLADILAYVNGSDTTASA